MATSLATMPRSTSSTKSWVFMLFCWQTTGSVRNYIIVSQYMGMIQNMICVLYHILMLFVSHNYCTNKYMGYHNYCKIIYNMLVFLLYMLLKINSISWDNSNVIMLFKIKIVPSLLCHHIIISSYHHIIIILCYYMTLNINTIIICYIP